MNVEGFFKIIKEHQFTINPVPFDTDEIIEILEAKDKFRGDTGREPNIVLMPNPCFNTSTIRIYGMNVVFTPIIKEIVCIFIPQDQKK